MKYTRLNLVADQKTRVIHDDFSEESPYSGSYEYEIDLRIAGLELAGEFELAPHASLFYDDHILVDGPVKAGDWLYLVVARYSDGDTFGETRGYHYLAGAFERKADADSRAAAIEAKTWPTSKFQAPWGGYFARLGSVDVERVQVQPRAR